MLFAALSAEVSAFIQKARGTPTYQKLEEEIEARMLERRRSLHRERAEVLRLRVDSHSDSLRKAFDQAKSELQAAKEAVKKARAKLLQANADWGSYSLSKDRALSLIENELKLTADERLHELVGWLRSIKLEENRSKSQSWFVDTWMPSINAAINEAEAMLMEPLPSADVTRRIEEIRQKIQKLQGVG